MIPDFDAGTGCLPRGVHCHATWDEIVARHGHNGHRKNIIGRLLIALQIFRAAGCKRVFLGGSFICDREYPDDFDGCFDDTDGFDENVLHDILTTFHDGPAGGHMARVSHCFDSDGLPCVEHIKFDARQGYRKGIIELSLDSVPAVEKRSLLEYAIKGASVVVDSLDELGNPES